MILLGLFGCPMGTPQPCSCDRHSWHVDSRRTFGGPWRGIAGVVVDEPRIRMDSWSISNVPIVCYLQCFSFWKLILLLPVTVTVARQDANGALIMQHRRASGNNIYIYLLRVTFNSCLATSAREVQKCI